MDEAVSALPAKDQKRGIRGEFELFRTSSIFDATTTKLEWFGAEPDRIQRLMPM